MGGTTTISNTEQALVGIKLQTSAYGITIPVVFGKTRLPGNLIYFTDFTAIPHTTTQGGGGKGGGVEISNTTYTYTGALVIAVCEGPITSFKRMWADKDLYAATGGGQANTWLSWVKALGTYGQAAWSYITTKHPTEAAPYSGVAYAAKSSYDMGGQGTIKNHSFEVVGYSPFNAGTIDEANVADIFSKILTDPFVGVGLPSNNLASLGNTSQFYKFCAAHGLFFSPAFTEQRATRDQLSDLAKAANSDFLWSEDTIKIVPYADANASGNGYTFVANTTPLYDLSDDDFLPWGSTGHIMSGGESVEPLRVQRKPNADAWNQVQIEFLDGAADYNTSIAEAKDQANIELYGLRTADPIRMNFITSATVARKVAQLILQRVLYVRNTYEFRLGWRYVLLEPGDLVTITDAALGLNKVAVLITSIEEDEDGALTLKAEEWPFGTASATLYGTQAIGGYTPNFQSDPGNANAPFIFEPPLSLSKGSQELWIAVSGGANWGGAEVWCSQDAVTYKRVGYANAGARHGVVQALYSGTDPLKVDLSVSAGTLTSASTSDAAAYLNLMLVGNEYISFKDATLTAANKYDLSTLTRGMHGSPTPSTHPTTDKVARIDESIFKMPIDQALIGKTLSFKFVSYNPLGGGLQDISTLSPYTYTVLGNGAGAIPSPSGVTVSVVKK